MAVAGAKPSVSVEVVKYQGRTRLLALALEIAGARKLKSSDTLEKLSEAKELRIWLKALDQSDFLTYEEKFRIAYATIDIGNINDFPIAPLLALRTRPNILIGAGGGDTINNYYYDGTAFINSDVDTPFEVVDSFAVGLSTGARWEYTILNAAGTALRKGSISAGWLPDGSDIEFGVESTTADIGDTSDVVLSADISGGNVRFIATVSTSNWIVKGKRYLD